MPIQEVDKHDASQLGKIAHILASSRKVIVMTGAGISTSCGIPDFRSQNGLYSLIEKQPIQTAPVASPFSQPTSASASVQPPPNLKKLKGEELFSSLVWNDALSTSTFHTFITSLRRKIGDEVKASRTHRFIRVLRESNRLLRCYTQNIDGLEAREGFSTDLSRGSGCRTRFSRKSMQLPRTLERRLPRAELDGGCEVVQLHGNLELLTCNVCRATCEWEEQGREALLLRGEAPTCPSCESLAQSRQDRGKRSVKIGCLRPNIVLYGEEHPSAERIGKLSVHDLGMAPDLLLILGTSLRVHGLKVLVKEFAKSVHARGQDKGKVVFVNLSRPSESTWKNVIDYWVSMDCDEWVDSVRAHRPDLWWSQSELEAQVRKPRSNLAKKTNHRKRKAETLCEGTESNAGFQDVFPELEDGLGIGIPERRPGDMSDREYGSGSTSGIVKRQKREDEENLRMRGRKVERCEPTIFSDSRLIPSPPNSQGKETRPPLQPILNQSYHSSSRDSFVTNFNGPAIGPRKIEPSSRYWLGSESSNIDDNQPRPRAAVEQQEPKYSSRYWVSSEPPENDENHPRSRLNSHPGPQAPEFSSRYWVDSDPATNDENQARSSPSDMTKVKQRPKKLPTSQQLISPPLTSPVTEIDSDFEISHPHPKSVPEIPIQNPTSHPHNGSKNASNLLARM